MFHHFRVPSFPYYRGEVHPADRLDTQLILKGSQGRVSVAGPITPGRASQAILVQQFKNQAPKTKRHLMLWYGNQCTGAFGIFQFVS